MLDHSLEDYFSYHPTKDPKTLALYQKINTVLYSICRRLFDTSRNVEIDRIEADLIAFIQELNLSDTYCNWIRQSRDGAISAARYQAVDRREGYVLMHMQSVRMFCNQAVTMDRLNLESKVTPLPSIDNSVEDRPQKSLLKTSYTHQGEWVAEKIYEFADIVHWSGKAWVWDRTIPGNEDPDNISKVCWRQFIAKDLAKPPALNAAKTHSIDLQMHGDMWCARIGENLQVGTAGFGVDPMDALCELLEQFKIGSFKVAVVNTDRGSRLAIVEAD